MWLFGWVFLCLTIQGSVQEEEDCLNLTRLVYEKPGNITITGIFDGNFGENCSSSVDFGVEEMAAAVWTVTALERYNYLPGIKIGLSLFDACSSTQMAHEAFAEAVVYESCQNTSNIGMLTTPEIESKLSVFTQKLNKTLTRLDHILDLEGLLTIVSELLTNIHWTTINRVIADSHEILNKFSSKMSEEGICVYDEVLSTDRYGVNNNILKPINVPFEDIVSKDSPVIVVFCKSQQISRIFEDITKEMRQLPVKWLLVPTDYVLNVPAENLPQKAFSILPLVYKKDRLLKFMTDEELQKDHMNHREATRSPLFIKTAVGILELLKPFRIMYDTHCSDSPSCPELGKLVTDLQSGTISLNPLKSLKMTPDLIVNALSVLKIDANDNEPFLYITSLIKDDKTEDAAMFQLFDVRAAKIKPIPLIVNERLFNERRVKRGRIFRLSVDDLQRIRQKEEAKYEMTEAVDNEFPPYDKHPCVDILMQEDSNQTKYCGICQNFIRFFVRGTRSTTAGEVLVEEVGMVWSWRFRTWVAINASVASIGTICTMAVFVFIVLRICKGDILEGSPYFSFLILLSILLMYASTLAYSVEESKDSSIICHLRVISPAVSYALLFSIILSRSVLVVFSERDGGIMNHVNGCLQSVLCFFMSIVQIALTVQFWVYNAFGGVDCAVIHSDRKFILLLSYSFFLLLLLAVVAPFTMRSKRNYREGTFFSIATVLVIMVWSTWITFYHLLPVDERDAAVALGLTATATAVLLSVFIPRTYLMATATVRDKITNTLPSLAYINASNISEINYRSNQALYDSVTVKYNSPKLSFSNPRIYSVHMSNSAPASPNNIPMDGADYVLNRRKTFIEVSRGESPENSYDSRETPDMTGKITRF
ncbi:UNVERIFIED_CONTAM: hypothetical protein PYX00_004684 [Menopon gallinae]|uniref:G-protein coupled receptors family 3 profile domain-containing protein n=1 Tax=Menopon gallinae TaxID=328185 RepID=A0AAW2I5I4_9NEOP